MDIHDNDDDDDDDDDEDEDDEKEDDDATIIDGLSVSHTEQYELCAGFIRVQIPHIHSRSPNSNDLTTAKSTSILSLLFSSS